MQSVFEESDSHKLCTDVRDESMCGTTAGRGSENGSSDTRSEPFDGELQSEPEPPPEGETERPADERDRDEDDL